MIFKKITCKNASELVSRSLDGKIGMLERLRLRAHLKVCKACRNFVGQMQFMRKAIRGHPLFRDDDKL
jgi:predicted anti-sigma-YlaC factor YlaD